MEQTAGRQAEAFIKKAIHVGTQQIMSNFGLRSPVKIEIVILWPILTPNELTM